MHPGPHREGDALSSAIIRGDLTHEPQPSGAQRIVSRDFPEATASEIGVVIDRARRLLSRP